MCISITYIHFFSSGSCEEASSSPRMSKVCMTSCQKINVFVQKAISPSLNLAMCFLRFLSHVERRQLLLAVGEPTVPRTTFSPPKDSRGVCLFLLGPPWDWGWAALGAGWWLGWVWWSCTGGLHPSAWSSHAWTRDNLASAQRSWHDDSDPGWPPGQTHHLEPKDTLLHCKFTDPLVSLWGVFW